MPAMLITVLLTLLIAAAVVSLLRWVVTRRDAHGYFKRMGVPFVPPHFVFGSNHIFRDIKTNQIAVLSKWKEQYGKVYGYFSGGMPTLVVTDLDMVKQILIKDFHVFSNRPNMIIKAEPVVSTLVGLRDQRWKDVRALLAPTFSMTKMKLMANIMNEKIDVFLEIISNREAKGEPLEFYSAYQGLTLDVICECALAIKSKCQLDQNDALLQSVRGFLKNAINNAITVAIYFPFLGEVMSYVSKKLAYSGRMTNNVVAHLKQVIKLRRKDAAIKTVDVLQLMLEASETILEEMAGKDGVKMIPKKKILSDDEIIANAWVFLLGGFETTANALTFTSFLLAKHQHVQERLFQEIKEIVPDDSSVVTYDQVSQMSYLDQVLSESLRLYPPVVTFIIREAAEDVEVCGLKIPAHTGILIPVWDIHRDPDNWPDPDTFDPDRFSSATKSRGSRHPMAYLPFGAGPRNCIGMRFGQLEAKLALVRLLRRYRLELSPGTQDPPSLVTYTVAINPAKGVYLNTCRRE